MNKARSGLRGEAGRKRAGAGAASRRAGARGGPTIPAAEFKAVCLKLMDRVKATGEEWVITKRGRPVAKLVPLVDQDVRPFVGRSLGVIAGTREAVLAPVGEGWELGADL